MKGPLLLNATATRKRLGVSERGLLDLVKRGMPFIKVGKRRMFPIQEIQEWIGEQAKARRPAGQHAGRGKVIGFEEACRIVDRKRRS